jgi:hypothetical protein
MPDLSLLPRARSDSRSGVSCVGWDRTCLRWRPRVTIAGARRSLGRYTYLSAAVAAVVRAKALEGQS